ncbi:uncharacterized protein PHACADRAFT_45927, partial [Phanerochaete carnosa HHB-10118-sp]
VLVLALLGRVILNPAVTDNDLILSESKTARVLLLTAHPDDECLFFAPTVSSLLTPPSTSHLSERNVELYSLCLSIGNAGGLGEVRRDELARSLSVLGIPETRRWLVDHPELPDNITRSWDADVIADTIKPYVLANNITTILTFDRDGISSHPNHGSLPAGAARLVASLSTASPTRPPPRLFSLITVQLVHKYIGPLSAVLAKYDLIFASLLRRYGMDSPRRMPVFISGIEGYKTALRAMMQHRSQLVWFRWLYVSFSRYLWVNEWVQV